MKTSRFDHDISCPVRGIDRKIECKRRKRSFKTIADMLAGNWALIVRDDNSPPLVIMGVAAFAELVRTQREAANAISGDGEKTCS